MDTRRRAKVATSPTTFYTGRNRTPAAPRSERRIRLFVCSEVAYIEEMRTAPNRPVSGVALLDDHDVILASSVDAAVGMALSWYRNCPANSAN